MDRVTFYPNEILTDTELLQMQVDALSGLGWLIQGVMGTNTLVDGLACTQTGPASLQVQVAPGAIYYQEATDATAYGSLGTNSNLVMKQGLSLGTTTLTLTAPTTSGQSVNYLVQVAYSDVDANNQVLSYFNSANPTVPFTGPGNTGASQPTTRQGVCVISLVAGTPATTGSQTTPSPSSGYTGLYLITLTYGQTTITNSQITTLPSAPFITNKLGTPPKPSPTVYGLVLSNDGANPNSVFDISAGIVTDKTATITIKLPAFTKTLSPWALGSGVGALDTGTVTNSRWYCIFAINNPTTGVSDILASLSYTSPTLPTGFTYSAFLMAIYINGSGNIFTFTQIGSRVFYGSETADNSLVAAPTTPTLFTLNVPTGLQVLANYRLTMQNGSSGPALLSYLMQCPSEPSATPNTSTGLVSLQTAGYNTCGEFSTLTNTNGQIRLSANIAGGTFSTCTTGFTLLSRGIP